MHKNKNLLFFIVYAVLFTNSLTAQERKYTVSNAHAHNDYIHPVPFWTAYNAGFGSIEADVFLRNNQLYVAHDTAHIASSRTLQSLYFNPLKSAIQTNNGQIFKDSLKHLLLLIDLKTTAESTLEKVIQILQAYEEITTCTTLKIVITGNQPHVSKLNFYPDYIYFDGNLKNNYTVEELEKVALFSDNFSNYTKWTGKGILPAQDKMKIDSAVTKAHLLSKPIRFWAAPDAKKAWHQLMHLQVDYINTDKISGVSSFLKRHPAK